jgi:hypothetical protein
MKVYKPSLDRISMVVSALCVVHCIVLPLFLTTLPLWGMEVLENPFIETATVLVTLLAGGWAIGRGYIKFHQHLTAPVLFLLGLPLMIMANYVSSESVEMLLKGSGAVLIISAHITNWKQCRLCCEGGE